MMGNVNPEFIDHYIVDDKKNIIYVDKMIEDWTKDSNGYILDKKGEKIIYEGKYLRYCSFNKQKNSNFINQQEYHQNDFYYNSPLHQQQAQEQILNQKQTLQQAMDLGACQDSLFQLLSTAELFAVGKDSQRDFSGYQMNQRIRKNKNQIREQLIVQFGFFQSSFLFFKKDYKKEFDFPKNLPLSHIIQYLNYWKSMVDNQDKAIYDEIINLLNGTNTQWRNISFPYSTSLTAKKIPNNVQMGNMMTAFGKLSHSNTSMASEIKKEFETNGRYEGKVILRSKDTVDPHLRGMHYDLNERVPGLTYHDPVPDNEGDDDMR